MSGNASRTRGSTLRLRIGWVGWSKNVQGGPVAYLRLVWWHVVRGYDSELCGHCGRPVRQVWWSPDEALFERVNGGTTGGSMCIRCFDSKAEAAGHFQRWESRPL